MLSKVLERPPWVWQFRRVVLSFLLRDQAFMGFGLGTKDELLGVPGFRVGLPCDACAPNAKPEASMTMLMRPRSRSTSASTTFGEAFI